MRRTAFFLLLPALSACTVEHWTRPDTSEQQRVADSNRCEDQARQSSFSFGNDPYSGLAMQDRQAQCMRALGYRLERK
ncbi:MAG: hypothetical protein KIT25_11205 [Enhydrobacter sp.]|nr:MAG: hypothetical protein KIT25_11205 [Enhydrobacter sp.]